jgi:ABC-type transport system involved in multi-copper enzyme maturation permease subunit
MLWEIVKKEIHEIIISPKFIFTFVLCTILILLSVIMGISNYGADIKEYDKAVALNRQELENRTSYIDIAAFGIKVFKRPQVLRTIVNGIEADAGRGLKVAAGSDPQSIDSQYQSNPVLAVFGTLDLAFIVRIVLSLLAVLFTYDSITGEKERGTLRLVLSNRIPKEQFILGKAIGGFLCLLTSLVVPFLLALLILLIYPNISLSGEHWLRISLLFLQFLLYISVFFMLGMFVSARTHRSTTSFLVLLFIWVIFVTIIPKISVMVAAQLRPIPSTNDMTVKKDQFLQNLYKESDKQIRAFVENNPPSTKIEEKAAWRAKISKITIDAADQRQKKYEEYTASLDREYQLRKRAQDQLAANLSRLSPAGSLMFASMNIARTGLDEHQRFLDSVRAYWPIWNNWSDSKIREEPESGPPGSKLNLGDMPQFNYAAEHVSSSIKRAFIDFGIMCFMIILFFSGAYWSFTKYDVR